MKVLLLFWGGGEGGDASATLELARAVRKAGVEVCVAARTENSPVKFQMKAEAAGLELNKNLFFVGDVSDLWCRAGLERHDFDLVHVHHGRTVPKRTDIVPLRTMSKDLPMVLTAHGPIPLPHITYGGIKSKISRFLSPTWFDAIVVPSEAKLREWRKMTPLSKNVVAIPNVVRFFSRMDQAEARRITGLPQEAKVALFCSRLDEEKDPVTFIRAVKAASETCPDLVGVMAGSGAMEKAVEELVTETGAPIKALGYINDPEPLYSAADIFVQPSLYESFCITLLQAVALGLPCVITELEVFRDFYSEVASIEWFRSGDFESCSRAMLRKLSLQTEPDAAVLPLAFREESIVAGHIALWERVLAKRKR